jgi:hypothetical protein
VAEWVGWLATAIFVSSYFFKQPVTLRRVQGVGALAWLAYGVLIHSNPVIVANLCVAGTAIWSSFLRGRRGALGT